MAREEAGVAATSTNDVGAETAREERSDHNAADVVGISPRRSLFDAVRPSVLTANSSAEAVLVILSQRGVLALAGDRPDKVVVGGTDLGQVQPGWMVVDGATAVGVGYGIAMMTGTEVATPQRVGVGSGADDGISHRRTWCVLTSAAAGSGRALDALITVAQRPAVGLIVVVIGEAGRFTSTLEGIGLTVFRAAGDMWSIVSGLDLAGRRAHLRPVAVVIDTAWTDVSQEGV